jgi:hypothetical protein
MIAYQAKLVDIYGAKLKHLHSNKKKTSELLIGLRFSMEDRRGVAKEAHESYDATGSQLSTITEECLDLQKQVRVLFYYLFLLETVQEFILHFSDGFNFCRSLLDLRQRTSLNCFLLFQKNCSNA